MKKPLRDRTPREAKRTGTEEALIRLIVKFGKCDCHPEQAFFAPGEPALSEAEGDLGEPREAACPEQAKRAEWVAYFATQ